MQFTLLKLGSTDATKLQGLAMIKSDSVINLTDQLPTSFPYMGNLEYIIKYEPRDDMLKLAGEKGVEIHVHNRFVPLKITAYLTGSSNQNPKSYIAGAIWTNIVHIPAEDIKKLDNPIIKVDLESVDRSKSEISEDDLKYSNSCWTTIQIGSGTKRLEENKPLEGFVDSDDYKYYIVKKPKNLEALIILTVVDGESDLYVKKGVETYPTKTLSDYSSNSVLDDEITLPKTGQSADLEEFTVGVYGALSSRFRISFFINSGIKIYPVKNGEFIHKFLEKGESLILQYDVSYGVDKYVVGYMAEHTIVNGLANFYDEYKMKFLDAIPEESKKE